MKNLAFEKMLVTGLAATVLVVLARPAEAASAPSTPSASDGWPAGKGLSALQQNCSGCHSPALVRNERHDAEGWDSLIGVMIGRGAQVSEADEDLIRDYLTKNFGEPAPTKK